MKVTFMVTNRDDMEFQLQLTMSLRDWKQFREQLDSRWPSSKLSESISIMIRKADLDLRDVVDPLL